MIYLTTDHFDHAVYFDLRKQEPKRSSGGGEYHFHGLVGNGFTEVLVTVKKARNSIDMAFGRTDLFDFVDERTIRRLLSTVIQGLAEESREKYRH